LSLIAARLRSKPNDCFSGLGSPWDSSGAGSRRLRRQRGRQQPRATDSGAAAGQPAVRRRGLARVHAFDSSELAWWDGVSFVLASFNQPDASSYLNLFARRFDSALGALDDALPGAGARLSSSILQGHSQLSVSSNGKGRSLLLSEELSGAHLGFAIRGEFLSNDGAPTPKPIANAAAGEGGEGGEGGEAGEAGAAGSSAVASGGTTAQGGSSGASGRASTGGGASSANGGAVSAGKSSTEVAPSLSSCSVSRRTPANGFAWGLAAVAAALSVRRARARARANTTWSDRF